MYMFYLLDYDPCIYGSIHHLNVELRPEYPHYRCTVKQYQCVYLTVSSNGKPSGNRPFTSADVSTHPRICGIYIIVNIAF